MDNLRILMVDSNWRSGLALYTRNLCREIANQGQSVDLLTSTCYPDMFFDSRFKIIRKLWPAKERKGYRFNPLHYAEKMVRILYNNFVRTNLSQKGGYDIVHFQALTPIADRYLLTSLAGKVRLVHTVHDTIPHSNSLKEHKVLRKKMYRLFDLLIVHYEKGKKNLIELYDVPENRIKVMPHGLKVLDNLPSRQDARQKLGIALNKKILLFFGTIRADKGLDVLLHSLEMIKDMLPDVLLVIAGKASGHGRFSKYDVIIKSSGIEKNVLKKIGFIPDEEVSYYFCAADVCVLPYKRFDSQSGVLMQAYAHYKPVVVTNVGAVGDVVCEDGTGVIIKPNNAASLADGIIKFFQHQQEYSQNCSRTTAEKYSWSKSAEMAIKYYRDLLRE